MFRGLFFAPDDFEDPAFEQHLEIYQPAFTDDQSASEVEESLEPLRTRFLIAIECDKPIRWHRRKTIPLEVAHWRERANSYLNLPKRPIQLDLTPLERGELIELDDLDYVLIGWGKGTWVVIHWYSTA